MKLHIPIFLIALILAACQSNTDKSSEQGISNDQKAEVVEEKILAIDILLDPDQVMLDKSKFYNDRMRENYPEGFALDASHQPHITVIQAFIKESALEDIKESISIMIDSMDLAERDLVANGLYYMPYDGMGLAGITVKKDNLMDFHNQIVAMMQKYSVPDGTGMAFVQRPDGESIMQATSDYVNSFVPMASGENYNPHVTIGTAYEDFVKEMLSESFVPFTFKAKSVSIYQLGELGTAQKNLGTIPLL